MIITRWSRGEVRLLFSRIRALRYAFPASESNDPSDFAAMWHVESARERGGARPSVCTRLRKLEIASNVRFTRHEARRFSVS